MAYGTMSIGNAGFTKKFISILFLLMHPKGSLFHSDDPTSPAELYGGTWERIEDCTIWGASSLHPAGTKLEAGLPNITGCFYARPHMTGGKVGGSITYGDGKLFTHSSHDSDYLDNSMVQTDVAYKDDKVLFNASAFNAIYGASDTVQPPAYCMYIWRRVA
nr:MAG TPA: baseplate protein [Caudoviricetes sp.]